MDFGAIIKRAWQVMWQHKALWVLGVFAGISGCQSTGGGGGSGTGWRTNYEDLGRFKWGGAGPSMLRDVPAVLERLLPLLVAAAVLGFMLMMLWAILGVAARGGLVIAVNEIEEGRKHGLGTMWGLGLRRFWSLLGLEILVGLPVFLVTIVMLFGVFAPLLGPLLAGRNPGAGVVAPVCGSLCLGVPVLIVLALLLGMLRLVALRYVMLGGQGAFEALGNSWRFFRARFKDTVLMYLINAGLNIAAAIVLAIPGVIIGVAAVVPVVVSAREQNWAAISVPIAGAVLALVALSLLYAGIWGTYTSALWTLFFRRVVGMDAPAVPVAPEYGPPPAPPMLDADAPAPPPAPPAPLAPPEQSQGFEPPPVAGLQE